MRVLAAAAAVAVTAIAPNLPPVKGWPPYPKFPASSCWARVTDSRNAATVGGAPSYLTHTAPQSPQAIVASVLSRLGDPRFVKRVELGPVPRLVREHNSYFKRPGPPKNALWAWFAVPRMGLQYRHAPPAATVQLNSLAEWEAQLVWGALRDAFCANGGRPLVGWSVGGHPSGVSDANYPLGQRFPSPTRDSFVARAHAVGRKYGFGVISVRWLKPLQAAPIVVVRTNRDRKRFVGDVPAIVGLLDPRQSAGNRTAATFEGFYFEAVDAKGPFVSTFDAYRGTVEGGQWSWNPCVYPYAHGGLVGQHC